MGISDVCEGPFSLITHVSCMSYHQVNYKVNIPKLIIKYIKDKPLQNLCRMMNSFILMAMAQFLMVVMKVSLYIHKARSQVV